MELPTTWAGRPSTRASTHARATHRYGRPGARPFKCNVHSTSTAQWPHISGTIDNQISITANMLRFRPTILRWVLAASMACFLLAGPLHQAKHAAEPIGKPAVSASCLVSAPIDQAADSDFGEEEKTDTCLWCLFHAAQFLAAGAHTEFSLRAESSPPPTHLSPGLPPRHCLLAAHPRGPPVA